MACTRRLFLGMGVGAGMAWAQGALPSSLRNPHPVVFPHVDQVVSGGVKGGAHTRAGMLVFEGKDMVRFVSKQGGEVKVPYRAIRQLHYDRVSAAKSLMPLLFVKGSNHFLTMTYEDPEGRPRTAIWRMGRKEYQQVLGVASSRTGLRIEQNPQRSGQDWWDMTSLLFRTDKAPVEADNRHVLFE